MRTTFFILSPIEVVALAGLYFSVLPIQQTSAQMMNPNMMFNGTGMNPNMMFNGTGVGNMFAQDQNITGSINLMPTIFNSISSQIKVNLSDAVLTAQTQVGNDSRVVSAHLDVVNGYVTYTVCAIDPDMTIHRIVIDAGNGNVLSSSNLSWQDIMKFGHMMMGPNMMGPNMMGHMRGFP
jgi:hypothetical protein